MNTHLLETFVAVAEELHFRRAAERLHLAQPAVSRQIRRLEDELGVQLFVRDQRKVILTEAGRIFLREARTILAQVELAQQQARRAQRGELGGLSVGYSEFFIVNRLFPGVVHLYRERFPEVALQMHELLPAQHVEALLEDVIDVGVVWMPVAAEGLRVETLFEEPLMVALPADHPLSSNAQVALEDLAAEPFVLFPRWESPGYYDLIIGACQEAGLVPRVVLEANTMKGMASMVAEGIGVSFLPHDAYDKPGVVYKEITHHDLLAAAALVWRSEDESPVLKGFLEVARVASRTYSGRKPVGS
jgi:DNA-binding transcriptional LysR family regulator